MRFGTQGGCPSYAINTFGYPSPSTLRYTNGYVHPADFCKEGAMYHRIDTGPGTSGGPMYQRSGNSRTMRHVISGDRQFVDGVDHVRGAAGKVDHGTFDSLCSFMHQYNPLHTTCCSNTCSERGTTSDGTPYTAYRDNDGVCNTPENTNPSPGTYTGCQAGTDCNDCR